MVRILDEYTSAMNGNSGAEMRGREKHGVRNSAGRALILVVDDSAAICNMLGWALELAGFRVVSCAGGEAWIDNAMLSDDPPALILLDINIPSMNGSAFLHRLRARWKAIPSIIVMTTNPEIYRELAAVEHVICKPFHIHDLVTAIEKRLSPAFRSD